MVPSSYSRYDKISSFSKRDDVISSILKREKAGSFNDIIIGTAVTNLTRLDFPITYGNLELDRMIVHPGGAFPLNMVNLVIGVVTCANKLSFLVEFAEERINTALVNKINEIALKLLLDD